MLSFCARSDLIQRVKWLTDISFLSVNLHTRGLGPDSACLWASDFGTPLVAAEPETEEWDKSNEANWDWGYDIACNINATIQPVEE